MFYSTDLLWYHQYRPGASSKCHLRERRFTMFDSLRGFIEQAQELDDCQLVENADWERDIGALTEWASRLPDAPMLLFDRIKNPGYCLGPYPTNNRVVPTYFQCTFQDAVDYEINCNVVIHISAYTSR